MRNRCFYLSMVLLGILFVPQKSLAQSTISCNSDDEKRHSCSVDTRGGVRLLTQHSEAACTEGYSWGSDDRGIWVDHGCRAEFTVDSNRDYRGEGRDNQNGGNRDYSQENRDARHDGGGQSQSLACNSDDERRHTCAVDTRGGVRLAKQNSGSACTEGYSWGSDDRGIWVDHGCRADFLVGGNRDYREENRDNQNSRNRDYREENRSDPYGGNEQSQTFACNSDDMRKHSCAVDTQGGGVRLLQQHSEAACTRGYSWGTNRRGVWVDHGCRADFAVVNR